MKKEGFAEYINVLIDPVIKKSFFIALFLRLIPWSLFFLSIKYTLPGAGLINAVNIAHVTITLLFPIWMAALYYLPKVTSLKSDLSRTLWYIILLYIILTPILVFLGALFLEDPLQFFKSYKLI